MRLDVFLVSSRLIKRRSLAQEFCEKGLVRLNGIEAKSAKEIKSDDLLEIHRRNEISRMRILTVPEVKQVSRASATSLFEVLSTEKIQED